MTDSEINQLVKKAKQFAENSYVPVSERLEGSAVLTDGKILFGGCLVENDDLGLTRTAVEIAILKSVSEGHLHLNAICKYSNLDAIPYLTGAERQLVWQFGKDAVIICANDKGVETYSAYEMFPYAYEGGNK